MKEMKMRMGRMEVRFLEERKEWRLPGLLYGEDLVLWGKSRRRSEGDSREFCWCVEEI